jgi:hypothetical protein
VKKMNDHGEVQLGVSTAFRLDRRGRVSQRHGSTKSKCSSLSSGTGSGGGAGATAGARRHGRSLRRFAKVRKLLLRGFAGYV